MYDLEINTNRKKKEEMGNSISDIVTMSRTVPVTEETQFIQDLQSTIDRVTANKGTFASSGLVNAKARITSDRIFNLVANHFRAMGHTVYAPTKLAMWLEALQDADRNELTLLRGMYTEMSLGNVILVRLTV
mgnify:CR=1 FL=1